MKTTNTTTLKEYRDAGGNPDSAENQRIAGQLVDREIVCCVSSLVYHFAQNPGALEGSNYSYDDVLDLCTQTTDKTDEMDELQQQLDDVQAELDELDQADTEAGSTEEEENTAKIADLEKKRSALQQQYDEAESENGETEEAYEHWAVTDWFAGKLKDKGEITGELFDLTIWGRTCTGQAIKLDSVVQEIAAEMEILAGQKNDWSKQG